MLNAVAPRGHHQVQSPGGAPSPLLLTTGSPAASSTSPSSSSSGSSSSTHNHHHIHHQVSHNSNIDTSSTSLSGVAASTSTATPTTTTTTTSMPRSSLRKSHHHQSSATNHHHNNQHHFHNNSYQSQRFNHGHNHHHNHHSNSSSTSVNSHHNHHHHNSTYASRSHSNNHRGHNSNNHHNHTNQQASSIDPSLSMIGSSVNSALTPQGAELSSVAANQRQRSSGPPHYVDLHVNVGECVSLQLLDGQEQVVAGPTTVTLISQQQHPPVPIPVQVPPGHMIHQIADENGTLKHIILSLMDTGDGSAPLDSTVITLPQGTFRISSTGELVSTESSNSNGASETRQTVPLTTLSQQAYFANYDACPVASYAADAATTNTNTTTTTNNNLVQQMDSNPSVVVGLVNDQSTNNASYEQRANIDLANDNTESRKQKTEQTSTDFGDKSNKTSTTISNNNDKQQPQQAITHQGVDTETADKNDTHNTTRSGQDNKRESQPKDEQVVVLHEAQQMVVPTSISDTSTTYLANQPVMPVGESELMAAPPTMPMQMMPPVEGQVYGYSASAACCCCCYCNSQDGTTTDAGQHCEMALTAQQDVILDSSMNRMPSRSSANSLPHSNSVLGYHNPMLGPNGSFAGQPLAASSVANSTGQQNGLTNLGAEGGMLVKHSHKGMTGNNRGSSGGYKHHKQSAAVNQSGSDAQTGSYANHHYYQSYNNIVAGHHLNHHYQHGYPASNELGGNTITSNSYKSSQSNQGANYAPVFSNFHQQNMANVVSSSSKSSTSYSDTNYATRSNGNSSYSSNNNFATNSPSVRCSQQFNDQQQNHKSSSRHIMNDKNSNQQQHGNRYTANQPTTASSANNKVITSNNHIVLANQTQTSSVSPLRVRVKGHQSQHNHQLNHSNDDKDHTNSSQSKQHSYAHDNISAKFPSNQVAGAKSVWHSSNKFPQSGKNQNVAPTRSTSGSRKLDNNQAAHEQQVADEESRSSRNKQKKCQNQSKASSSDAQLTVADAELATSKTDAGPDNSTGSSANVNVEQDKINFNEKKVKKDNLVKQSKANHNNNNNQKRTTAKDNKISSVTALEAVELASPTKDAPTKSGKRDSSAKHEDIEEKIEPPVDDALRDVEMLTQTASSELVASELQSSQPEETTNNKLSPSKAECAPEESPAHARKSSSSSKNRSPKSGQNVKSQQVVSDELESESKLESELNNDDVLVVETSKIANEPKTTVNLRMRTSLSENNIQSLQAAQSIVKSTQTTPQKLASQLSTSSSSAGSKNSLNAVPSSSKSSKKSEKRRGSNVKSDAEMAQLTLLNLNCTSISSNSVQLRWSYISPLAEKYGIRQHQSNNKSHQLINHFVIESSCNKCTESNSLIAPKIVYQGCALTCRVNHLSAEKIYHFKVRRTALLTAKPVANQAQAETGAANCTEHLVVSEILSVTLPSVQQQQQQQHSAGKKNANSARSASSSHRNNQDASSCSSSSSSHQHHSDLNPASTLSMNHASSYRGFSSSHNSNNHHNSNSGKQMHGQPIKLSNLFKQCSTKLVTTLGKLARNSLSSCSDTKFAGLLLVLFTLFAMLLAIFIHHYIVAPVTE